ncbi:MULTISPECIES: beta-ketoacyl synthase N-terminal-like domain-containing protein [Streptomyces]|uniref:beta-ketoacyl synthase N-terminal-like domain-containing protein n=1 Tax=Streptomyces TaxID=1883 RepID=UPI00340A006D
MDNREILTRFKSGALDRQQVLAMLTGNGQAPVAPEAPVATEPVAPAEPLPPAPPADGFAVVAVDCAFPGAAAGTAGFWDAALRAAPEEPGDTEADAFDPAPLRIAPDEADALHPAERLLLHRVWHALEGAGYAGARLDALTGPDGEHRAVGVFTAAARPHTAALLSRVLDLSGPGHNVDTGPSSYLTAVHQALGALRTGECAAALVAGGGGTAVLLLRPLAAARAAGDRVHAVLTASAAGHPGRGTSAALRERLRRRASATAPVLDEEGTGAAALVRAVLQLRHGVLLPGPGRARPEPWPAGPRTALAGVYEDDAPYAVVALREPPPAPPEPGEDDGPHLVLLSAATPRHLAATAGRLADWLTSSAPAPGPGAVARELRLGRAVHDCRLAVVVHDTAELAGALAAFAHGDAASAPGPVRDADLRGAVDEPLLADGLPETRDYLAALWRGRRFEQLARLWLAGADVPAGDRTGPPGPVIELPTSALLPKDGPEARRDG